MSQPGDVEMRIRELVSELILEQGTLKKALPDVAKDLLELVHSPRCDAVQVERVVARDPFITAQVVSAANSAMFAPRVPIRGVREAVVRIGLDAVQDLALMAVMNSTMFRVPGFETEAKSMRRRALASACAARAVTKVLASEAELGFMSGLLHDVGELVILEQVVAKRLVVATDRAQTSQMWGVIESGHAQVGAAVLRAWKLPVGVVEAAALHHQYRNDGYSRAGNIAAVSDLLAAVVLEAPDARIDDTSLSDLGLSVKDVADGLMPQIKSDLSALLGSG